MDREKLVDLKERLDKLLGINEPSDEDLDFDEDIIQIYAEMHNLREAIELYEKRIEE